MHRVWFVVLTLLVTPSMLSAATDFPRIRMLDPDLARLLKTGLGQSETLRRLVSDIERTDVIVHIMKRPAQPRTSAAALQFVTTGREGTRYLRVRIVGGLPDRVTLSLIGHELQHALEVAQQPGVVDQRTFRRFYRAVGFHVEHQFGQAFDTLMAREVQSQVLSELDRAARQQRVLATRPPAGDYR